MKRSKFNNRKVTVDGVTFDSAGEARRWAELQLLERAGTIRNLERQVRVPLVVNGVKVCAVVIDFAWFEGEKRVWSDHKSACTRTLPVWRVKAKLVAALYPNVELREHVK